MTFFSLESGYRNSGLTIGKAGKIVLAVRSTHGLEVPLTDHRGKLLVDEKYTTFIAEEANVKLSENKERIRNYERKCRDKLFTIEPATNRYVSSFKAIEGKQQKSTTSDEEND